jgi:hypothetical protein
MPCGKPALAECAAELRFALIAALGAAGNHSVSNAVITTSRTIA